MKTSRAFTLIELLMALAACAVVLAAIFGVLSRSLRLRDNAMERTREVRLRAHAASVLRNDLRHALVSGGLLAATLKGSPDGTGTGFPGYLKFTATTAKDVDDEFGGDVQEIEYFINRDTTATDQRVGVLVRTIKRELLDTTNTTRVEERILTGLESMDVSFYSSNEWKTSWEVTETERTLPEAIRVILQPVADETGVKPAPIEVLVPWTTQSSIPQPTTTTQGTAP